MTTALYVHSLDQASVANTSHAFFSLAIPPAAPLQIGLRVQLFLLSSLAGHTHPAPDDPLAVIFPLYFTGKIVAERMEYASGREYLVYNDDHTAPIQRAFIRAVPGRGEAVTTDIAAAVSARLAELVHADPRWLAPTEEHHPAASVSKLSLFRADDHTMRGTTDRGPVRLPVLWEAQAPGVEYPILVPSPIQPLLAGLSTQIGPEPARWLAYERAASTPPLPVPCIRGSWRNYGHLPDGTVQVPNRYL
ncbi:hypothetical protein GY45DRAFT_1430788 [Cubamyces sp. BRFM 1775]|nr:hypothetical protein GY45DRAFT_1430788 [Cubamyces sp. BRFM 1775]